MKSIDVVALGEVLIDHVATDNGPLHSVGGSPANLVMNLSHLGHAVQLISAVGKDTFGQTIRDMLRMHGVNDAFVAASTLPTSQVFINQSSESPEPIFHRGADRLIEWDEDWVGRIESAQIFHFTYWPLTEEPALSTTLKCIEIAKQAGVHISFDPNYHPALKTSQTISSQDFTHLLHHIDIIKPSLDDALRMFQIEDTPEGYLARFEAYKIPLIILTMGRDGVWISHRGDRHYYPARVSEVIDATGAGDAFLAGYLSGVLHNYTVEQCIEQAQTMSARALKTIGAIAPLNPSKGAQ